MSRFGSRSNWITLAQRFLLLTLIVFTIVPQPVSSMAPETLPEAAPQAISAPAQALGVSVGAHLRPLSGIDYGDMINTYNQQVGKDSAIIMWFASWKGWEPKGEAFDPTLPNKIAANATSQPVIMITWLPISGRKSTGCSRDYPDGSFIGFDTILNGGCDNYIRDFARGIAARDERYLIRFAHEMNLPSAPFWPGHFGLRADAYVRMYRYVHDLFMESHKAAGGDNAEWVWSPNYFSDPAESWNFLHNYYPGDEYVDWIGLSGYNFYPRKGEPNRSFKEVYGDVDGTDAYYTSFLPGVLYDLACHYAKPQILAEIAAGGTDSTAANKVNWINDTYARIPNYPFVRAVVWYNDMGWAGDPDEIDLRVTNINPPPILHSSITPAYRQAISSSVYKSTLPSLEAATPPSTYCGNGSAAFQVSPQTKLVGKGTSTLLTLSGMLYTAHPTVTFPDLPSGFSASVVDDRLSLPWGQAVICITAGKGVNVGVYPVKISVNGTVFTVSFQVVEKISQSFLPSILH